LESLFHSPEATLLPGKNEYEKTNNNKAEWNADANACFCASA
jgi:hypothetical protein